MKTTSRLRASTVLCLLAAACASSEPRPEDSETIGVELCDGKSSIELAERPSTRAEGEAVARALMAEWKAKNPGEDWEEAVRSRHWIAPSHDNSGVLVGGQSEGAPSRAFSERDLLVWKRETERMVVLGARIFHSGDELGSTIAVSCDMCHPDAANTHPETYPKYQTQIGKTVLLRDMINWCLQHPVRAQPMAEDDPRMRALEAYIYAQRSGTALAYGKH